MRSLQLLIIDDEPAIRQILSNVAADAGHSVSIAANGSEALGRLAKGDIDLAVCDIRMPDMNGIEVVEKARAQGIDTLFLMMTAYASVDTAIEAMRAGAYDYTIKPLRNEDFLNRIERLADVIRLKSENEVLREMVSNQEGGSCDLASPAMREINRLVGKVAPTDSTVMITGPSGCGKGVIAKRIHDISLRAGRALVPVNCGAIPDNLLESEFFGHTKGAFTGAGKAKRGLFVEADQGTLFLDEIGELPLNLQVKLLHVIEDQHVRALGSEQARKIDVRIIAATNRDLATMVNRGDFREDLYFRLNVFHVPIPPLRERKQDLAPLIEHFIGRESAKLGLSSAVEVRADALRCLLDYDWPGNIRELQNVIARAMILAENGIVERVDLPPDIGRRDRERVNASKPGGATLKSRLRHFEQSIIRAAIDEARGDRKLAAKRLGIGVSSIYRKLEQPGETV